MKTSKSIQIDAFEQKEFDEMLSKLTDEQRKFVTYDGKKSIIMSSTAGSGKSFCCVQRLKVLLNRGVDPKKIIFFSFTNAAVDELKERVNNKDIRITTIHSFCFWMLHRMGKFKKVTKRFQIYMMMLIFLIQIYLLINCKQLTV
jgi:superfamily I DNA/RNA helicase